MYYLSFVHIYFLSKFAYKSVIRMLAIRMFWMGFKVGKLVQFVGKYSSMILLLPTFTLFTKGTSCLLFVLCDLPLLEISC